MVCKQYGWTLVDAVQHDQAVYRCFCAEPTCVGYAMTSRHTAKRHVKAGHEICQGVDYREVLWP